MNFETRTREKEVGNSLLNINFKPNSKTLSTTHRKEASPMEEIMSLDDNQSCQTKEVVKTKERDVSENLESSVHNTEKLKMELEKYRKWEISAEIETKRKEMKLAEAQHTIEVQRKSLLDLQLQNEKLSQVLVEEKSKIQVTTKRMEFIMNFCNSLRQYTTEVEERLTTCEQVKDNINNNRQLTINKLESFAQKFEHLTRKHEQSSKAFKSESDDNKRQKQQLEYELQRQATIADQKINSFIQELSEKEDSIKLMTVDLQSCQENMKVFEKTLEHLHEELNDREFVINNLKEQLEEVSKKLGKHKSLGLKNEEVLKFVAQELHKLGLDHADLRHQIVELKNQNSVEVDELRKILKSAEVLNDECQSRIQVLIQQQELLETEITCLMENKDLLVADNCSLKENLEKLTAEKVTLLNSLKETELKNAELEQIKCMISEKNFKIEALEVDLSNKDEQLKGLSDSLESTSTLLQSKQSDIDSLMIELEEVTKRNEDFVNNVAHLHKQCERESFEKSELIEELKTAHAMQKKSEEELKNALDKLDTTETHLKKLCDEKSFGELELKEAQKNLENFKTSMEEMQFKIADYEKLLSFKDDELEKIKSKVEKCENRRKVTNELRAHSKELKQENVTNQKYIKKLQDEIDNLKQQLTKISAENNSLNSSLQGMKNEQKAWKSKFNKLSSENEVLTQNSNDYDCKVEKMESIIQDKETKIQCLENEGGVKAKNDQLQKAECEREDLLVKNDQERKDLISVMDNFKIGNQKIIEKQQNEIEVLRQEIQSIKSENDSILKKKTEEINKKESYCKSLEEALQCANKKKDQHVKQVQDLTRELQSLKMDLKNKDDDDQRIKSKPQDEGKSVFSGSNEVMSTGEKLSQDKSGSLATTPLIKSKSPKAKIPTTPKVTKDQSILKRKTTPVDAQKQVTFYNVPASLDSETSASDVVELVLPPMKENTRTSSIYQQPVSVTPRQRTKTINVLNKASPKNLQDTNEKATPSRGTTTPLQLTPRRKKLKVGERQQQQQSTLNQLCLSPAIIMKRIEIKQPLTPATQRKPGKNIFKTPQGERTYSRMTAAKKSEDHLKWFEEDGLFGFHYED